MRSRPSTSAVMSRASTERQPQALWRTLVPVGVTVGLGAVALHAVALQVVMYRVLRDLHFNDFGKFYYGAQHWRDGASLYGPTVATLIPLDRGRAEHFWNLNPPHFHLVIWPLLALPIPVAHAIWMSVNVLAVVAAVRAILKATGQQIGGIVWVVIIVLAAASGPALAWTATGQFTGLLMWGATIAWLALRDQKWTRAGVTIGLLCSLKMFLAPLAVYLLVKRQWRATYLAAICGALPFLLGVMIFGVEPHEEWLRALSEVYWTGAVMNASIHALLGRAWSQDIFVTASSVDIAAAVLSVVLLGFAFVHAWRTTDADAAILMLLVTSLLASPLGWIYYVPILAGPITALLVARRLSRWTYASLAALMIPFPALYPYPSRLYAFTVGSLYTWSLLGIWAATALSSEKETA